MNHYDAPRCLERALSITTRLRAAEGFKELATEISNALLPEISKSPRAHVSMEIKPSFTHLSFGKKDGIHAPWGYVLLRQNPLQGIHSLEILVAYLIAAHVSPRPTLAANKPDKCPSFAFFVSALSTLARLQNPDHDFMRICEAAREAAIDLAAAAIYESHAETLGDMQRGINVVANVDHLHSVFSRHVSAVIRAYTVLVEKGSKEMTKADVRENAIKLLEADGFTPEGKTNFARWRELFIAAGLDHLPQSRGKRPT